MRIFVKGGVWKNTEDEILKAAVMKYGKQNWARVASLLSRKNAAQCKARWYEWLDPSIKKTDWDREEDEKLLHLAKIMPTQWRTIAPIVGRTAGQCLERYEFLLDKAQRKDGEDDEEAVGGLLDPRRLRAGEVDPNPESRPARPDPVDMDDDEKEMLSEARARLANTRGKKAKRKAREKLLMDAKRIGSLQKIREMKAAGIWNGPRRKRRKNQVDYNAEIPFEKLAPDGLNDITAELESERMNRNDDKEFTMVQINKLEAKRRDQEENKARIRDKRKFQQLEKMNLPLTVSMLNDRNDPSSLRKRSKLSLPAPTITDSELEVIVKAGASVLDTGAAPIGSGGEATPMLYGTSAAVASIRTPAQNQSLMDEARNHLAFMRTETPLKGGENVELHGNGTGFQGIQPNVHKLSTPNILADQTPGRVVATPMTDMSGGTPLRDEYGLNRGGVGSSFAMVASDPHMEIRRRKEAAKAMRQGFASLPQPQYDYAVTIPEVQPEAVQCDIKEEDAATRDARIAALAAEEEKIELAKRSTVLKRELPRPVAVNKTVYQDDPEEGGGLSPEGLLINEQLRLLLHDSFKYPVKKTKKNNSKSFPIEDFSSEELSSASDLLRMEIQNIRNATDLVHGNETQSFNEWFLLWRESNSDICVFENEIRLLSALSVDKQLEVKSQKFKGFKGMLEKEQMKCQKLEQRVNILNGGYMKRSAALKQDILAAHYDINNLNIELKCFQNLHGSEKTALPIRVKYLADAVATEELRGNELQKFYSELMREKELLITKA